MKQIFPIVLYEWQFNPDTNEYIKISRVATTAEFYVACLYMTDTPTKIVISITNLCILINDIWKFNL